MRNKTAKKLKREAESETTGKSSQTTMLFYRVKKARHKKRNKYFHTL